MTLADYWAVILKHRSLIVRFCVIAAVVTGIISILMPRIYAATTSIVPPLQILEKESEATGALRALKDSLISRATMATSIADLYVGILKSRGVQEAIIDKFNLLKVYNVKRLLYARRQLQKNTDIETSKEGIVYITVKDKSAAMAAALANAYVDELDRQNKRLSVGQATSKRIFLENRLREIDEKLSRIDNISSREARTQEMLFELLTRECELAKIEEARSMPTIQVIDRAVEPETRMSRGVLRRIVTAGFIALLFGSLAAVFIESSRKFKQE
ncbi:MAG: Wzz/FepE/Etk N-terminal domain-containing protein [Planctomycetota bacterium]